MSGTKIELYFGVPGAGKTHTLANRILELRRAGFGDVKIASLTNATKDAFIKRAEKLKLKVGEKSIKTLHGFCRSKLNKEYGYEVLDTPWEWFKAQGFDYNKLGKNDEEILDIDSLIEVEYIGVFLHRLFDLLRITWDGWKDLYDHYDWFIENYKWVLAERGITTDKFLKLFNEFMDYQEKVKKIDYANMLYMTALKMVELDGGDVLVIDEAQDFGTLHWSIINRWMKKFRWVLVGGDDDQAIYSFIGANPSYLLDLAKKGDVKVLSYSFRLPERVVKCSNALISLNKERYPKTIETKKEGGVVETLSIPKLKELIKELKEKGDILILTRTRKGARELSNLLYAIPHKLEVKETGPDFKRFDLWRKWKKGEKNLEEKDWNFVFASNKKLYKEIKEKLQNRDISDKRVRWLLEGNIVYLSRLLRIPEYILQKWVNMHENPEWEKSRVRIMTIHRAKGDEADYVFIDTTITPKILEGMKEDPETERRVWYVALTRAKKEVYILYDKSGKYPNYPLENEIFPLPDIASEVHNYIGRGVKSPLNFLSKFCTFLSKKLGKN